MSVEPKSLKEIIFLDKGKPPANQPYYGDDAEIYLTPEYLRGRALAEPIKPAANSVRVAQGETIILWDGSNAGEIFRSRAGHLSSTMSRVRHGDEYLPSYFYYSLKAWESHLKGQTSGSGIPHVDKEVLGNLSIFHCEIPEQAKIAEVLSTVDRAIEQTEALIEKQQRIKTGLMADLLTQGIDADGNLRSEATHAFKDSPLGRIPVEWEVVALGATANISSGITLGNIPESKDTIDLPYLRVANVQDEYLDLSTVAAIRVPRSYLARIKLEVGDVLMNEGGDFDKLGRGTIWRGEIDQCLHQNHVFKVRPQCSVLQSEYLAYVSASPFGKAFFVRASKQSTNLTSINSTQLKSFPLPLRSYDEQVKISNLIDHSDRVLAGQQHKHKKLHALKTALMQDLLTGKKRVTPLMEEVVAG